MPDRINDIIGILEENAAEVTGSFDSLTPDALSVRVYDDGPRWTVRQVLAHLITIEGSMQKLFGNILAGGPGAPLDFDIDRFNRTQPAKLDGLSMTELLHRFSDVRRQTIAMVAAMTGGDLDRTGRHPFHGHGKLERFVRWAYEHARLHLDDVRRALETRP
jgi:hypothetical protein